MALANGPDPKHKMSLGTALSYVRWSERKAEVEAWVGAAWAAAKRRWTARWMPIVAALGILAALVLRRRAARRRGADQRRRAHAGHRQLATRLDRHPRCDLGKCGARPRAARRCGAGQLARGDRCNPDGGTGARCGGHAGAPQPPRRRDVSEDQERPADEPDIAQPRSSRGGRSRPGVGAAHRCRSRRARAGRAACRRNRVAACPLGVAGFAERARHFPRFDRAGPAGADARRLHRQRQPRVAHAARVAARLRRDAAGPGPRRRQRPHAFPDADGRARPSA